MVSNAHWWRRKGQVSNGRTGSNTWVAHDRDATVAAVAKRIAALSTCHWKTLFQIIHYGPGQEYRRHYDSWIHNGSEATLRCMRLGGARTLTALCYLNTVKGGNARMVSLNKVVDAREDVYWCSEHSGGQSLRREVGRADMPVIAGGVPSIWFREERRTRSMSTSIYLLLRRLHPTLGSDGSRSLVPTRLSLDKHLSSPDVVSCAEAEGLGLQWHRLLQPPNYRPSAWISRVSFRD